MRISPINALGFKPLRKVLMATLTAGAVLTSCANNKMNKANGANDVNVPYSLQTVNIGNILFYTKDLVEYYPVNSVKNKNGQTDYQVALKSGTVIRYSSNQPKDANVIDGIDMGYEGKYYSDGIKFSNCKIKFIVGTDKRDYYYLSNSNVDTIDFGKCTEENMKDELRLDGSYCKHVIAQDGYVRTKPGRVINMNEGWFEHEELLEED